VEPLGFADVAGPERLAFSSGERGRPTHVAYIAVPETSFSATHWFDRPDLHGALLVAWLAAALSALVALFCASLTWQLHHWNLLAIQV